MPHDPVAIERVGNTLRVPPIVAQLLLNRGVNDPEAAEVFLHAPFRSLRDPELLPGVPQAADLILATIRAGKKICVYGDYDVDGLTGTAILLEGLRLLGAATDFYVPHRLDEGYGVNAAALGQIASGGSSVVITVDCGITSVAEADEARRLGLGLIVSDHHEYRQELPRAAALVHPRLPGTSYPFGDLSGSGVAFKLAWALCQRASGSVKVTPQFREYLLDSVTLAALGMVADVVPLRDENRIFVRHGLARMAQTNSIGLQALLQSAGLAAKKSLTARDVGFTLAPRLNAAGRLGCARLVVELLTTTSKERAAEVARYLEKQNEERQKIERRIHAQAREHISETDLMGTPALVLANHSWHAGVIGIVAGKLAEQYGRPVLLISLREDSALGLGSGRSIPGFPLHEALSACGNELASHGGHAAAAGFKIERTRIAAFREQFCAFAARRLAEGVPPPSLVLDAEVPLNVINFELVSVLDKLEPYGAGNARPLFLGGPAQVSTPRRVGSGERHLSFRVRQNGSTLRAIAFNMGDRLDELISQDGWCSLAFTPCINEWQGYRSVQLEVRDFQAGMQARLE